MMSEKKRKYPKFALLLMAAVLVAGMGCTLNSGTSAALHPAQTNPLGTHIQDQVRAENDSNCEIQEFNRTIIRDYTVVPLTEEDLSPYPEFGQYFESTMNATPEWGNDGTRLVGDFDCNESVAIRFYNLSRKYEGFPNQPVFEYHGRYYKVFFNSYIWHSLTEVPTQPLISTKSIPESATPLPSANVTHTSSQQSRDSCPAFLVNPPEFSCPREMQPLPETHAIADPDHPTQKEIDAIPVDFPGVDRMTLINAALADPCVKEFLKSGGVIEGITDQPRPLQNKTETVRWPPTLMADRRVNCTDLLVFFDIDPSSGRVTRIWGETR